MSFSTCHRLGQNTLHVGYLSGSCRDAGLDATWWDWLLGLDLWDSMTGSDTRTCGIGLGWAGLGFCQKLLSDSGDDDKLKSLLNESTV